MGLTDILAGTGNTISRNARYAAGLAGLLLGAWMPDAQALNHPPNPATVDYTIPRGGSVSVPVTVTSDPDGDPLVWGGVNTSPQHGLLKRSADKLTYTFTPYPTYTGNDSFIIGVIDPSFSGAPVKVNVTITYSNSPPQASAGTRATPTEGRTGSWPNVLTNVVAGPAADDGQQVALTGITAADPSHFKTLDAILNPDGTVTVNGTAADYIDGMPWWGEDADGNPVDQTVKGTFRITFKDNAGGDDTAVIEAPYTIGPNDPDSFAMTPVEQAVGTFVPDETTTRAESGWSAIYTLPAWPLTSTPMKQSGKLPREPADDRARAAEADSRRTPDAREAGDKDPVYKKTGTGPALMADVTLIDSAGNIFPNTSDPAEYYFGFPGHGIHVNTRSAFDHATYNPKDNTLGELKKTTPLLLTGASATQAYPWITIKTKAGKDPFAKTKLTATCGSWADPGREAGYPRDHEATLATTVCYSTPFALPPLFDDGSGLLPLYAVGGHTIDAGRNDITHVVVDGTTHPLGALATPVPCGGTVRFGRREQANQPRKPDIEATLDETVAAGKTPLQGGLYVWSERQDDQTTVYVGMRVAPNTSPANGSSAAVLPKKTTATTYLTIKVIPD